MTTAKKGRGTDIPPLPIHVSIYFQQKGFTEEMADAFFCYHQNLHWKDEKGNPVKNWKTLACEHIWQAKHG